MHLVFFLFVLQFVLGAVGIDDVGIFQSTHQAGLYIINVDAAQLVPLCQLFFIKTFCLSLCCQLVDSGDNFFHVHIHTSYISVDNHPDPILFRLTVDGIDFDFTKTSYRDLHAF